MTSGPCSRLFVDLQPSIASHVGWRVMWRTRVDRTVCALGRCPTSTQRIHSSVNFVPHGSADAVRFESRGLFARDRRVHGLRRSCSAQALWYRIELQFLLRFLSQVCCVAVDLQTSCLFFRTVSANHSYSCRQGKNCPTRWGMLCSNLVSSLGCVHKLRDRHICAG